MEYPIDVQLLDKFHDSLETEGQQDIWSRTAFSYAYSIDPSVEWSDKRCTMRAIKFVKALAVCFDNVMRSGSRSDADILAIKRFGWLEDCIKIVFGGGDLGHALDEYLYYIAHLRIHAADYFEKLEKLPHAVDGKVFDEFTESVIQYVMNVPGKPLGWGRTPHDYTGVEACYELTLNQLKWLRCQEKKLQSGAGALILSILNLARANDLRMVDSPELEERIFTSSFDMSLKLSPYHADDVPQLLSPTAEPFLNLLQSARYKVSVLDYILRESLKVDLTTLEVLLKHILHVDHILSSMISPHLMQQLSLIKAELFGTATKTSFGTIGEALAFLTDKLFTMPLMHMTDTEKLLLQLIPYFLKEAAASSSQVSEDVILESSLAFFKLYKAESLILLFSNNSHVGISNNTLYRRNGFRDILMDATLACEAGRRDLPVQLPSQLSSEVELNMEEIVDVYEQGSLSLFHDFIKSNQVVSADHLQGKLRKLLANKPQTFSLVMDQVIAFLGDLELLGSFFTGAKSEDVRKKVVGLRMMIVLHEVEYIVDMFLRGDSPEWYQQLLIFNALNDTKSINTDMGSFEWSSMLKTTDDQAKNIQDLLHNESIYYFHDDGVAREYWRNYVYAGYVLNPSVHWTDEESTMRATKFLKTIQFFYNTKHGGIDPLAAQCHRRRAYLKWLQLEIHHVCDDDPHKLSTALSESLDDVGLLRIKFADACYQLMKVPAPARFRDGDMFSDLVDSVQHYLVQRNYKATVQMLEQFRFLVCRFSEMCTDQKRLQSLLPPAVVVVSMIQKMAYTNETYTGEMDDMSRQLYKDANADCITSSKQPSPKSFLNLLQIAQNHAQAIDTIMDLIANEQAESLFEQGYTEIAKERWIFELILSFLRDTASLEAVFNTPTGTLVDGNVSANCVALETSSAMNELPSPTKIDLYFEDIAAVYLWLFNNSPRNDSVSFNQHLLEKLRTFAVKMPNTNVLVKDQFQAFLKDMVFLNDSKNKDFRLCVKYFLYVAEYIVDMLILGDGPQCYHQLVLFIAIREVELIKAHFSTIIESSESPLKDDQQTLCTNISRPNGRNLKTEGVVVGFDDHAKNIVQLLDTGSKNLQVFSIVGMAGIGKTTLAMKVYNIFLSEGRFAVCAGSSVSQVYRKRELLLEILADFSVVTDHVKKLDVNDLALKVYRSLKGKRYLILLDDIWRIEHWNDLRLSFPDDKKGSRILFTTRVRSVAEEVNNTIPKIEPYFLPLLSLEQSWDLLQQKVFPGKGCPEQLHEVGRLVAEHCKGLPLAVVVVAGILEKIQEQTNKWEEIAAHLTSRVTDNEDAKIMGILELSYNHLPSYLKSCFLYLGSFSEDQEIQVKKLQWLWMGEGLIPKDDTKSLEEIAGGYLVELINRSLIMESKRCCLGGVKTCRIHDMLREFCLKKAKEENFMQLISMDGSNESESPVDMQYRLCVHSPKQNFTQLKYSASHVHSLLFFATDNSHDKKSYDVSSILQNFKPVRVLDLETIKVSIFPGGADLLLCLNYIAIKGNINSIPDSISKLWNLETLIVNTWGEVSIPSIMWSIATLRNVHIRPRASLSISKPELENCMAVENLTTFSSPVFSNKNVAEKILKRCTGLGKLRCVFMEQKDISGECNEFPAMEFLTRLESLNIYYIGKPFPCKFSFPLNLKKLALSRFCMPWDYMKEISKLQHLEVLKLLFKAFEGNVWDMSEEIFPKLRVLVLDNLNLSNWIAPDCQDCFPELERVVLRSCKKLEEVPSSLGDVPTLKQIEVQWCSWSASYSVEPIYEQQVEFGNPTFDVAITPSEWNFRRSTS